MNARSLILLLGLTMAAAACTPQDPRPNVVLLTLDTTRPDHLGAYGAEDARTPSLDALAARGVVFERAYSPVPLTLPSHTTILTGLSPHLHGVHDNGRFVVPEALETLPERLGPRGHATAAFVSAYVLDRSFGLDRGFDVYDDQTEQKRDPLSRMVPTRPAAEVTDAALGWLGQRGQEPFFLWAHYYDPHEPLNAPPPFDAIESGYAAEIAYMDAQIGRLLAGVERAARGRETLVLVVADHGESLGEHDEPTHGVVAYDSTLHVPLIAAGPGFAPGTRSQAFVTTEDVTPTILALLGEPAIEGGSGVPLQATLAGEAPTERLAYFESFGPHFGLGWARLSGVRTARWKYTAQPEPAELYDVQADSRELADLSQTEPDAAERLATAHDALLDGGAAQPDAAVSLGADVEAQLAALGYLTTPQSFEGGAAPDPRRGIKLLGLVQLANGLARRPGRLADAIRALELISIDPTVRAVALRDLARIQAVANRPNDAIESYEKLLTLTNATEARIGLANALLAVDRDADALAALDAIEAGPGGAPPQVALLRGRALQQLGRLEESMTLAESVLAREPGSDPALALASRLRLAGDNDVAGEIERLEALLARPPAPLERLPETRVVLALLLRREGRDADAVRLLEAASDPPRQVRKLLAEIARQHGDVETAIHHYEALLAISPALTDARHALAELYDEVGRSEEAIAFYDELIAVHPDDPSLRVDRGATLYRAKRYEDAAADYRAALAADDAIPEAAFNLGLLELEQSHDAEAERLLLRTLELRPGHAKAHFHLARLYRKQSDPRAARHAELAAGASAPAAVGGAPPAPAARAND